jgi:hypothetical protein
MGVAAYLMDNKSAEYTQQLNYGNNLARLQAFGTFDIVHRAATTIKPVPIATAAIHWHTNPPATFILRIGSGIW